MLKSLAVAAVAILMLGSGCASVSDYLSYPMGEYRVDKELRSRLVNKTAITRGAVLDTDTGEVVIPAGTKVTIRDIQYHPTRFPDATGEVIVVPEQGKKVKLGFTSRIKEHFLMELGQVLIFDEPSLAEAFPGRMAPAEERALQIAIFKQQYVGKRLWLVRDLPCITDSKRPFLPAGTEVHLNESSVVLTQGVDGEQILSWLEFTDGDANIVAVFLEQPRSSFAEWYVQMDDVVTAEQKTVGRESLPRGLSREAVLDSWGPPDRRRGRLSNAGVQEEWMYHLRGQTLVFVDGRLSGK